MCEIIEDLVALNYKNMFFKQFFNEATNKENLDYFYS